MEIQLRDEKHNRSQTTLVSVSAVRFVPALNKQTVV